MLLDVWVHIKHSLLGLISLSGKRIKCAFTLEMLQDADGSILLRVWRMLSEEKKKRLPPPPVT